MNLRRRSTSQRIAIWLSRALALLAALVSHGVPESGRPHPPAGR